MGFFFTMTVLPWEARKSVHSFRGRAHPPRRQGEPPRSDNTTPSPKTPSLPARLCKWQHAMWVPLRPGMLTHTADHLVHRSWWGLWSSEAGMRVGTVSGEELCQGEEWRPRGIMERIQPWSGNKKCMKACDITEQDRERRLFLWVRNVFLFKTNSGADTRWGKKKLFRDADGEWSQHNNNNNTEASLEQRFPLRSAHRPSSGHNYKEPMTPTHFCNRSLIFTERAFKKTRVISHTWCLQSCGYGNMATG